MSSSGAKLSIVVLALLVIGSCSAKIIGFKDYASLTGTFDQDNETLCEYCNRVIESYDKVWHDEMPPFADTPEKMAEEIKKIETLPDQPFYKALNGKELIFAKAYFKHRKDHTVNPCKEVQIC